MPGPWRRSQIVLSPEVWSYLSSLMPVADQLGESFEAARSTSLQVLVDIKDTQAGHVGQVLENLDFYFRWAVAIEESLLKGSAKPPFPKPSYECGLYIADVRIRSFWASLTAGGSRALDRVDPQKYRGIRLLLAFLTVAGCTTPSKPLGIA